MGGRGYAAHIAAYVAVRIRVIVIDVRGGILYAADLIRAIHIGTFVPVVCAVLAPIAVGMSMDVAYIAAGIAGRVSVIVIIVRPIIPSGSIWTTGIDTIAPVVRVVLAPVAEPVDSFVCSLTVRNPYFPSIA